MEIKGMRDLERQLKKIEKAVQKEVDGEVAFSEIFNEAFMREHTKFESIDEFFDKSPFEINNNEDLEAVDESKLDVYVQENSSFDSWETFHSTAGKAYVEKKLKKLF